MGFWERNMPRGMLVRSAWSASSLSDPREELTLDAYEAAQPRPFPRPLPGEELPRYGRWFQERAVPNVDERLVASVERSGDGFELSTADGERHLAARVVIATGLASFRYRPAQFAELDEAVVTHSMDVPEPARFSGRTVAVVGCGQSAVETAALLAEADAEVELIARAPAIRWLIRGEQLRGIDPILQRVLYAPTDVGPAGVSRLVAMPLAFRLLPRALQDRLSYRSIRPAATSWLHDRTATVTKTFGRQVASARAEGEGVRLNLDDGSQRLVDHVILATGYRVDVSREPIIGSSLRAGLRLHDAYPILGRGFESSVPGLHFLGAYSAWSFGPIMRFVAGTKFTAREVTRHLTSSRAGGRARTGASAPPDTARAAQTAMRD
jgi:cation diffusion facilitator CzcD-associated flavoprotein CzcO